MAMPLHKVVSQARGTPGSGLDEMASLSEEMDQGGVADGIDQVAQRQ